MPNQTLSHITLTEVPSALVLFAAGIVLGGLVTFALRYARIR